VSGTPFTEASIAGPWTARQSADFLDGARIPLRVATLTSSGGPSVISLWFMRVGDDLLCATRSESAVARALRRDARCGFEVAADAPPYHGVRGRATAQVEPDRSDSVLSALIERYLGNTESDFARWMLSRAEEVVVLRLTPERVTSWDYRSRMADALGAD